MNDNTAKIINLEDYLKARLPVKADVVEDLINATRTEQDMLRKAAGIVLRGDHKVKEVEQLRDKLIEYDLFLLEISSFLEKQIASTQNKEQKEKDEGLQKQCAGLQSTNEKIKKLVTDDIAKHKTHAINPIAAAGTMLVTPFSVEKIVETFVSKQPNVTSAAYDAGAALGLYLAFHHQWNTMGKKAVKIVGKMPTRIKSIRRHARNTAFALTMSVSVSVRRAGDIEARQPDRLAARPKTMFVAKM